MAASHRFRPRLESLEDRLAPATLPANFHELPLATGISAPTAMEIAPDGRIFVLEQAGNVRVVYANGGLQAQPFLSLSIDSNGERGLLGIAFDPNFAVNQNLYLYYTVTVGSVSHNRVSRFTANGNTVLPGSEQVILDLPNLSTATNHNGGAIHFGKDGKLYIGVGENGNGANSQSLANTLGKLLRINSDGSIPNDNPFVGTATGINQSIWALGLRNPFTFAVQPGTGRIFINDVGEVSFEEINDGIAGANYGWPNAEGVSTNPAFTNPLLTYAHGAGTDKGFAITGGSFYSPLQNRFPADYTGDYFYADLTNKWIRKFDPSGGGDTLFATGLTAATVDLKVDVAGRLYYLSRGTGPNTGTLVRADFGTLTQQQAFVRGVYQDFLGRPGTLQELDGWAARLPASGASWNVFAPAVANVVNGIARSHEALQRLVGSYYRFFLGRTANGTEELGWVAGLENGASVEQVQAGILGSPEFAARASALENTGNADADYVRALYRLILRRPGTQVSNAEVQGWTQQLPARPRGDIALDFFRSFEHRNNFVQTLLGATAPAALPSVPNLLKRVPPVPSSESKIWEATHADLYIIELAIAGTQEYYNAGH